MPPKKTPAAASRASSAATQSAQPAQPAESAPKSVPKSVPQPVSQPASQAASPTAQVDAERAKRRRFIRSWAQLMLDENMNFSFEPLSDDVKKQLQAVIARNR